jgi:hypothetical protein
MEILIGVNNKYLGVSSGAETVYPSGAPEFTLGFSGVRVAQSLNYALTRSRKLKKNRQYNGQKKKDKQ